MGRSNTQNMIASIRREPGQQDAYVRHGKVMYAEDTTEPHALKSINEAKRQSRKLQSEGKLVRRIPHDPNRPSIAGKFNCRKE